MNFAVVSVVSWLRKVYPLRTLWIVLVVTVVVWFAGPLGTFEAMHPVFRGIYWGGLIFGAVPFAYGLRQAITRRFPGLSTLQQALLVASGFSVLYTPVVFLATYCAAAFGYANGAPVWDMWMGTFLASAAAYLVRTMLIDGDGIAVAATEALPAPRLMQRLDSAVQGTLISLSVRDHYVDVRTEAGSASLLMRLSDAIAETEGVEGAQVHRSHWVAWGAVEGVERVSGNLVLRMAQGARIPVSRNHRDKLEARGLL